MSKKQVTVKDIAKNTGVSIGTVHRVLYGKEGVGEETRKKILAEIKRTNYQVNSAASAMKRKPLRIVVVLPKCEGEDRFYFRGLWKGIMTAAEKLKPYKVDFQYIESKYGMKNISKELMNLFDESLDEINGIITLSDDEETGMWIKRFKKQGITVVSVSSYSDETDCLCSVRVDHKIAGRLAAEYLDAVCGDQKGKILVLTGDHAIYSNRQYSQGFLEYERQNGHGEKLIELEGFTTEEVQKKCRAVLEKENIIGIISCTARTTYAICKLLDEMNMKTICCVGTDVFLELEPYFESGLLNASIYQSNVEQGEIAVDVMYRFLAMMETSEKTIYMPVGIAMGSNRQFYIS